MEGKARHLSHAKRLLLSHLECDSVPGHVNSLEGECPLRGIELAGERTVPPVKDHMGTDLIARSYDGAPDHRAGGCVNNVERAWRRIVHNEIVVFGSRQAQLLVSCHAKPMSSEI